MDLDGKDTLSIADLLAETSRLVSIGEQLASALNGTFATAVALSPCFEDMGRLFALRTAS